MRLNPVVRIIVTVLFSISLATIANAQASRTWVSGVGDDANPCSRTAPCKTFAGAISKTASGGEIDVLDPGGFGAVTITKPITLDGQGVEASILVSGTPGVTINFTSPSFGTVNLRNLSIQGISTGTIGVHVVAAGASGGQVNLDNVAIMGFAQRAFAADGTTPLNVNIYNCHFWNNAQSAAVFIPPSTTAIRAVIAKTSISNNGLGGSANGVVASNGSKVTIRDCEITNNSAPGVEASTGSEIFVDNSNLSYNTNGAKTSGGTLWLSRSIIVGGSSTAVLNSSGSLNTFGDNRMAGNSTNNTGTAASPGVQ